MKTNNDTLNAIQTMVNNAVDNAGYNSTRNAVIVSRNANNTYNIKMDGVDYKNVVCYGCGILLAGEVVKVIIPNGQASQMFVLAINPYPVGSIYQTTDADFDPNVVWGGTWEKIEGRMLIGADDSFWVKIATEGQSFTLNTQCVCRWGAGAITASTYYQKTLAAGTYTANATTFDDQDPATNTVKEVYVRLDFGTMQGEANHTLNTYEMPSHTHSTGSSTRQFVTRTTNSAGIGETQFAQSSSSGKYCPSIASADNWYGVAVTDANGSTYTHSNMPPYEVVHIWKRTA